MIHNHYYNRSRYHVHNHDHTHYHHSLTSTHQFLSPHPITPFTSHLSHLLGVVEYSDMEKISIADIPGLVDGASEDKGLGHDFLRHIERTKV